MHSARVLLLGQGHAATRGMRANEDSVAASLPVQSQRLHPSHCHTPGPSARCCGLQHQQRAACPCAPALHPHPLCMLPRTISRHFQHGALAPLSRGCNTNAAPPPASSLPSAAHEGCAAQQRRAGGQGDDGFISENKRNVKRRRVRRRGDIQRDCEARDLTRLAPITHPIASILRWRLHPPARRRGGTIGWPLLCPAQLLCCTQTCGPA